MKNTHFFGQPIFSQLLSLVDRSLVSKVTSKNQSDRYYKSFDTWQHLVTMLYCTFSGATSLMGAVYGSFSLEEQTNSYRNT